METAVKQRRKWRFTKPKDRTYEYPDGEVQLHRQWLVTLHDVGIAEIHVYVNISKDGVLTQGFTSDSFAEIKTIILPP